MKSGQYEDPARDVKWIKIDYHQKLKALVRVNSYVDHADINADNVVQRIPLVTTASCSCSN